MSGLLENQYLFILVFVRIATFVSFSYFFGDKRIPKKIKAGLILVLTLIISPNIDTSISGNIDNLTFIILLITEVVNGFVLGFITSGIGYIFLMAGSLIDTQGGFSMVQVFDPASQTQVSLVGKLMSTITLFFFIANDFHLTLLQILLNTFSTIKIGTLLVNVSIIQTIISFITYGVLIALPVLLALFLIDCVLAISAKVMPQMNLFSLSFMVKTTLTVGLIYVYCVCLNGLTIMMSRYVFNFLGSL